MNRLHHFERFIDQKLRGLFRHPVSEGEQRELVEVHRAILDDVASHVERLPRGKRVFPYVRLDIRIAVPAEERHRAYEVVFADAGALGRDVRSRLEDEEVEIPTGFDVHVDLVAELPSAFAISYISPEREQKQAVAPAEVSTVTLSVVQGKADREEYEFRKKRINIGRLSDVPDAQQRLTRRNDVAFSDAETTVSRAHAHLQWEPAGGRYRLFDDRSATGTTVLREGDFLVVPPGASKGVPLQSGDEIVLGQARMRFEIKGSPP